MEAQACKEAYFLGNPWPDHRREALHLSASVLDDWLDASADDFAEMMEEKTDEK
jgi:hypothetical protein